MEEIKLRAWDEAKKIMHNDFQFISSGETGSDWIVFKSDKEPVKGDNAKVYFDNPYFRKQLQIMRFTGLVDKNGADIYEGDIVKFLGGKIWDNHLTNKIGKVIWNDDDLRFDVVVNGSPVPGLTKKYDDGKFEIVGNIYQNINEVL